MPHDVLDGGPAAGLVRVGQRRGRRRELLLDPRLAGSGCGGALDRRGVGGPAVAATAWGHSDSLRRLTTSPRPPLSPKPKTRTGTAGEVDRMSGTARGPDSPLLTAKMAVAGGSHPASRLSSSQPFASEPGKAPRRPPEPRESLQAGRGLLVALTRSWGLLDAFLG